MCEGVSRLRIGFGERLLLWSSSSCSGVGIFLSEALDATSGVDQLLLAGEERVAVGADFDFKSVALDGGTGGEIVAAGAVHRDGVIVGVNTGFHEAPVCRVRSARLLRQGRRATAASLGRAQFLIIRQE